ncbi:MAG: hypothetical protein KJ737_03305 [Proteobacteria bacterium]|nr:hypothetical protein [Pseudomonadota bacterium]
MSETLLSDLMKTDSLPSVIKEVRHILDAILPGIDFSMVIAAFNMTVDLYEGRFPGYQACNTDYHDLRHTTDTIIAMVRLIHGASIKGQRFTDRQIMLGMITALFHDAGYILEEFDNEGTGAKYTAFHVDRSMAFLGRFGEDLGLDHSEIVDGQQIILCTDLEAKIPEIRFSSKEIELLGKMLGVADLFAQMADRTYLEKLKFLYSEFKEGQIGDYTSEIDLLKKTVGFYDFIETRVKTILSGTDKYMKPHFAQRWGISEDLYHKSISNQKAYLKKILANPDSIDPRKFLKRQKIQSKSERQC